MDDAQFHAATSGHSNFSESTEEKKPLTKEEKEAQIAMFALHTFVFTFQKVAFPFLSWFQSIQSCLLDIFGPCLSLCVYCIKFFQVGFDNIVKYSAVSCALLGIVLRAVGRLQERLKQKRLEREEREKQEQLQREKSRRVTGKDMVAAKAKSVKLNSQANSFLIFHWICMNLAFAVH